MNETREGQEKGQETPSSIKKRFFDPFHYEDTSGFPPHFLIHGAQDA